MNNSLVNLSIVLQRLNLPVLQYLLPPLENDGELLCLLKQHFGTNIFNTRDLIQLYMWHNGTGDSDQWGANFLMPDFMLMEIKDISTVINAANDTFQFIENRVVPIFATPNGEYLSLSLAQDDRRVYYSQLWNGEIDIHTAKFDSLEMMIDSLVYSFENDLFFFNEDGVLDYRDNWYDAMQRQHPRSEYWPLMNI